ncbi:hypothetical protein [Streptomyces sp. KR55]|uniref:hypothetical protein n=1 Tax=Streptomyces sp. KR55 TaxID=3457425 RepID=UPI003FD01F28
MTATRPLAPYVIPWTGEFTPPTRIVISPAGVSYADATQDAAHRDLDGVLWEPCVGTRTGRPAYAEELHPQRQRDAMENFRCAVCRHPADRTPEGMLWLLPLLDDEIPVTGWEGVQTVSRPCARSTPTGLLSCAHGSAMVT